MKKIPFLLIILSFLWLGAGNSDILVEDHVPGQFIIQLKVGRADQASLVLDKFTNAFDFAGMEMTKVLSERLNIWLFEFNQAKIYSDVQLLDKVKKSDIVHQAQFNHYIGIRETEPDDPEFPLQWHLKNTGQLGGVPGADIDATDAWDITTGGLTSLGDTVIIAIIDDGFNLGHDDLEFWENYHEIPMNGIDDDNNGFIDDYRGWNAYTSTGTISSNDHGTHVTGIAGAIGNNGIGVSGINWNAMILPVMGSTTVESIAVEAYAYVYAQRALYNESNGALGAYIVVSNCSFGVNYGNPENYPVWGSMYDSLGQIGVLSSGATANMNVNVDEVGDIPTAFDSDFLIAVTNTTQSDEKYLAAGWGPESIDLGAPGKNVYSTRQGNMYGYKTGTSMSAPQISGAVALMFAAAEPDFMASYHENLAEVSLLFKHYMLQGVDSLPDLEGITVTGGRLNVKNAIDLLLTHVLEADTDSLKMTLPQDSIDSASFNLISTADLSLAFEINTENLPGWLSTEPPSGVLTAGGSANIMVTFDASGVNTGIYQATIEAHNIRGDKVFIIAEMKVTPPAGVPDDLIKQISVKAYPNPFNTHTNIGFDLDQQKHVVLNIINQQGQLIRRLLDAEKEVGLQYFTWDGRDDTGKTMPDGIYYCRIEIGGNAGVIKLILMH